MWYQRVVKPSPAKVGLPHQFEHYETAAGDETFSSSAFEGTQTESLTDNLQTRSIDFYGGAEIRIRSGSPKFTVQ